MAEYSEEHDPVRWYTLRDLKPSNSRQIAYDRLVELGLEVYTPMREVPGMRDVNGAKVMRPVIHNLLFVHETKSILDAIIEKIGKLQYLFKRGGRYQEPITVPDDDMQRFKSAAASTEYPKYYLPSEITPDMRKRRIRIYGGPLDGQEGYLLSVRGSKKRHLLVELKDFFAVSVEVNPEYIELL